MAIARRGTPTTAAQTSAGTSLTINVPTGVVDGDCLILCVWGNTTTAPSVPAGWTLASNIAPTSGRGFIAWRVASSEPASYTVTLNSSDKYVAVMGAWSGADATTPIRISSEKDETSTVSAHTTNSITANAGEWVVSLFGDRSTTSGSKNTNWTATSPAIEWAEVNNNTATSAPWSALELNDTNGTVSAGSISATSTSTISQHNAFMWIGALQPASSGTSVTGQASLSAALTLTDSAVVAHTASASESAALSLSASANVAHTGQSSVSSAVSLAATGKVAHTGQASTSAALALFPLPSTPVLDDFNRTAENPLSQGGAWAPTAPSGVPLLKTNGTQALSSAATGFETNSSRAIPVSLPVEVYVDLTALPGGVDQVFLTWFDTITGAQAAGYEVGLSTGFWYITSQAPGGGNANGTDLTLQPGESWKASIDVGGRITIWRKVVGGNWSIFKTWQDPSGANQTEGYIGLGTSSSLTRFDNFGGGSITEAVVAHTGQASEAAALSLSATGKVAHTASSSLAGAVSMNATGKVVHTASALLTGAVSMSAAGSVNHTGSVNLAGTLTLSASAGGGAVTGQASESAHLTLSAAGRVTRNGQAQFAATATVTAQGTVAHVGRSTLNATLALADSAVVSHTGAAGVDATLTLSASALVQGVLDTANGSPVIFEPVAAMKIRLAVVAPNDIVVSPVPPVKTRLRGA